MQERERGEEEEEASWRIIDPLIGFSVTSTRLMGSFGSVLLIVDAEIEKRQMQASIVVSSMWYLSKHERREKEKEARHRIVEQLD